MATYTKIGRIRPDYADVWDSARSYTALEVVKSADSYQAYIAKQDVPAGTPLTDEAYWGVVLDVSDVIAESVAATNRANTAAEQADAAREGIQDDLNGLHDELRTKADGILCTAEGNMITLTDSSNDKLRGLRVLGKTTQDGAPTPETPVDLVSVGECGSVGVNVCGKNLFDVGEASEYEKVTDLTIKGDSLSSKILPGATAYVIKKTNYKSGDYVLSAKFDNCEPRLLIRGVSKSGEILPQTDYTIEGGEWNSFYNAYYVKRNEWHVNLPDNGAFYRMGSVFVGNDSETGTISDIQLEYGTNATAFEHYTAQTLTAQTPNGLAGIPVTSGGNYTDADGQRWVCDEVDFERGVYVKRIGRRKISSSDVINIVTIYAETTGTYVDTNIYTPDDSRILLVMSDMAISVPNDNRNDNINVLRCYSETGIVRFRFPVELGAITLDYAREVLEGSELIYVLTTPIETALTAEEIVAYRALHTNKPNTTVFNDAGAHMAVEYNADAKTYIDNAAEQIDAAREAIKEELEELSERNDQLSEEIGCVKIAFAEGIIRVGNYNVGDIADLAVAEWAGAMHAVIQCEAGDAFVISGTGGAAGSLWAILDKNNVLLDRAADNVTLDGYFLEIPQNGAKVVINQIGAREDCYHVLRDTLVSNKPNYDWAFAAMGYAPLTFASSWGIAVPEEGANMDLTPVPFEGMSYVVADCEEGDAFIISGTGGNTYRLWVVVDANNRVIAKSSANLTLDNAKVTVPNGGVRVVINQYMTDEKCYKITNGGIYDVVNACKDIPKHLGINAPVPALRKNLIVYGDATGSSVSFGEAATGFVCEVKPNTTYCIINPGGNRFKIVTTSFNAYSLYEDLGSNNLASDGIFYENEEAESCTLTTTSTDRYMYVYCNSTVDSTIGELMICEGTSWSDANKMVISNYILQNPYSIGYSLMDTHKYYSSSLDPLGLENSTNIEDLYAIYDRMVEEYPDQVSKSTFCTDTAGNVTYMYHIKSPMDTIPELAHQKKEIMVICGTHGFEKDQMYHTAAIFEEMLRNWQNDEALETLLWNFDFAVIPCLNVYGYLHNTRKNERGVDINRNYSEGWDKGTSEIYTDPSSENYHGEAPFSEIQSSAVRDYVLTNSNRICLAVDFHFAGGVNYIATVKDFAPAFQGWERIMQAWLYKKAIKDIATNDKPYSYVLESMDIGSTARYINTICPAVLLETLTTLGISDASANVKYATQCSQTAFVNALLYAVRYMQD